MQILVTGATGKVGSRLAKRLSERGDQVRALVRDPARAADLREARIELAEGDLLKVDSLAAPSPAHRIYNVVDDEAPDLATLFASVGAPPPDGSNAELARAFDTLMDGRRIREDLGFKPKFPRLADAIAAGA
jgi:nucleoside-diphosphate-sugar epimerase